MQGQAECPFVQRNKKLVLVPLGEHQKAAGAKRQQEAIPTIGPLGRLMATERLGGENRDVSRGVLEGEGGTPADEEDKECCTVTRWSGSLLTGGGDSTEGREDNHGPNGGIKILKLSTKNRELRWG